MNHLDSIVDSVKRIRKYTNRQVEIRLHPKDQRTWGRFASLGEKNRKILVKYGLKFCEDPHAVCVRKAACFVIDHTTMVF